MSSLALDKEKLNKTGAFFIGTIIEATNKRIVINYNAKKGIKKISIIASVILILMGVFFISLLTVTAIDGAFSNSVGALILLYVLVLAFPLMGLFIYKNTKVSGNQQVIFNRVNKTIIHPESLISAKHVEQTFNMDSIFIADYQGLIQSGIKVKGVPMFNRFPIFQSTNMDDITNYWIYIQDYIFNPALPAGTAFDDYR